VNVGGEPPEGRRARLASREALGEVGCDVLGSKRLEGKLHAAPVNEQLLLDGAERVLTEDDVGRTVGGEQEEPNGLVSPREVRDQVERRVIAPLQIVEPEHETARGTHRLERLCHLAEHAASGRCTEFLLEKRELATSHQGRHLDEPVGRIAAEDRRELVTPRGTAQATERLEHREIGFARTVMLQAVSAADKKLGINGCLLDEGIGERSLADSCLTGEKHDLPLASLRCREQLLESGELGRAPDHTTPLRRDQGLRLRRAVAAPSSCLVTWMLGVLRDRGNEAIASAMHRLDDARGLRVLAQSRADFAQVHLQDAVAHADVGPEGVEQLFLGDQPPRVLGQVAKHGKRLRLEPARPAPPPESLVGEVEAKRREHDDGLYQGSHTSALGRSPSSPAAVRPIRST
jgi:hypothetical protein